MIVFALIITATKKHMFKKIKNLFSDWFDWKEDFEEEYLRSIEANSLEEDKGHHVFDYRDVESGKIRFF